jgi:hypothetical protein
LAPPDRPQPDRPPPTRLEQVAISAEPIIPNVERVPPTRFENAPAPAVVASLPDRPPPTRLEQSVAIAPAKEPDATAVEPRPDRTETAHSLQPRSPATILPSDEPQEVAAIAPTPDRPPAPSHPHAIAARTSARIAATAGAEELAPRSSATSMPARRQIETPAKPRAKQKIAVKRRTRPPEVVRDNRVPDDVMAAVRRLEARRQYYYDAGPPPEPYIVYRRRLPPGFSDDFM